MSAPPTMVFREIRYNPDLFTQQDSRAEMIHQAERLLLGVADLVYTATSLKPMSKTLFLVSRALLALSVDPSARNPRSLQTAYNEARKRMAASAPADDYRLPEVLRECNGHIESVARTLSRVLELTTGSDSLGLVFDTLLRGKFEGGEGLGTFLTPEEVVAPMVQMAFSTLGHELAGRLGEGSLLAGDTCGGTGRFLYHIISALKAHGVQPTDVSRSVRLYDQSRMAVDLARINMWFDGVHVDFSTTSDSLTDEAVTAHSGRFALIATNPPFGTGKYRWTPALRKALPPALLDHFGLRSRTDAADPAALFVFRNLDLLATGGVLSIVLPDGIVHSPAFRQALAIYEEVRGTSLTVHAIISLPAATFALGGTVAKTSFLVIQKGSEAATLYHATAKHIGFKKKGNRRMADVCGNDLVAISEEFENREANIGSWAYDWHHYAQLSPSALSASETPPADSSNLGALADPIRIFADHVVQPGHYHISILDVDETGLIDVLAASRNAPVTKSIACAPGDVLISCLNPKIWRVTVVPDLDGTWTCSAEFAAFRPKGLTGWKLFARLHHAAVKRAVLAMASGTSSSRQRVPKSSLITVAIPEVQADDQVIDAFALARTNVYRTRMAEAEALGILHKGGSRFEFMEP